MIDKKIFEWFTAEMEKYLSAEDTANRNDLIADILYNVAGLINHAGSNDKYARTCAQIASCAFDLAKSRIQETGLPAGPPKYMLDAACPVFVGDDDMVEFIKKPIDSKNKLHSAVSYVYADSVLLIPRVGLKFYNLRIPPEHAASQAILQGMPVSDAFDKLLFTPNASIFIKLTVTSAVFSMIAVASYVPIVTDSATGVLLKELLLMYGKTTRVSLAIYDKLLAYMEQNVNK